MADDQQGAAASTASFWKRSKDKGKAKKEADQPRSATDKAKSKKDDPQTAKEKAQIRRAQVRRAQIQHRQRKASHVKQLELDVTQFRDMIALAEREVMALRKDNAEMKVTLRGAGVASPSWTHLTPRFHQSTGGHSSPSTRQGSHDSPHSRPAQSQSATPTHAMDVDADVDMDMDMEELFRDIDVDDLTVTLSVNKNMGTPCFQISSNSSGASVYSSASPPQSESDRPLTPAQEEIAVNFILSLEHICWNHFSAGDFYNHDDGSTQEKGHTLMASAYCMASAPDSVYSDRKKFTYSRFGLSSAPNLQWNSPSISLDSLHGLAKSLNPGGEEVAPVQAWFELASRYPIDLLLQEGVLERLGREFKGTVKCVVFGAAIERGAFESIIHRVLGEPSKGPGFT